MTKAAAQAAHEGTAVKQSPLSRYVAALELEAASAPSMQAADIVGQLVQVAMECDSLEEFVQAQESGLKSGQDMVDVEHRLLSFTVVKSEERFRSSSPLGHYVRVDCFSFETMQNETYATGAPNLVLFCWKARQTDRLPLDVVIRSQETTNGELLKMEILKQRPMDVQTEPGF